MLFIFFLNHLLFGLKFLFIFIIFISFMSIFYYSLNLLIISNLQSLTVFFLISRFICLFQVVRLLNQRDHQGCYFLQLNDENLLFFYSHFQFAFDDYQLFVEAHRSHFLVLKFIVSFDLVHL